MTDLVQIFEEKTLDHYIERITRHIEGYRRSGLAIARDFADADDSLPVKEFRALAKYFHFSYSTARKLVKVGKSDRIKRYEDKLVCIDAWSTLHEIEKLDATPFQRFEAEFLSSKEPQPFMRSDVKRFKSRSPAQRQAFSLLARIEVDIPRLQEPEEIYAIAEEVEQFGQKLGDRFPATRVRQTDLVARFDAKIEAEATKAVKGEVTRAVRAARKRLSEVVDQKIAKEIGANKKAKFIKHWGLEWEEIFRRDINPNDRLRRFGEEPIEPELVDVAFAPYSPLPSESGTCATSPEERAELLGGDEGEAAPAPEQSHTNKHGPKHGLSSKRRSKKEARRR